MATPNSESHCLECLEIWGGTAAVDEAVSVRGLDLHVFSRPFQDAESGGDVYLVSMCSEGNIARIMLADVAGHGERVSSLGGSLRQLMREHVNTADQTRLARELNAEFTRRSDQGRFATALLATYFAPTDHLILVNAGHPPPLHYRAARGTWELLEPPADEGPGTSQLLDLGEANLPLGIIEPTTYVQFAVRLEPDDLIVLYTDALIETRLASGEPLGTDGLVELLRSERASSFDSLSESIRSSIETLRGGAPAEDDFTLLVIHHNAAKPLRGSVTARLRTFARILGIGQSDAKQ